MSHVDAEIAACLEAKTSFLLDAGAGSGKTYSLVQALKAVLASDAEKLQRGGQKIACITFTNVAKDEIRDRIADHRLVHVSTIHDFLWELLQPHQRDLRRALEEHNGTLSPKSKRKVPATELSAALAQTMITYSDRGSNYLKGRLHHDDLLAIARVVFKNAPLLSRLTAARYPFLFVDEYQDTSETVIRLILESLLPTARGVLTVGFFGDKLQSIYHGGEHPGVGEIPAELCAGLQVIKKEENRRCSRAVIRLLNRMRTDIQQTPAADSVEGAAVYLHIDRTHSDPIAVATGYLETKLGWSLGPNEFKLLLLTHTLIGRRTGYAGLLDLYSKRSSFHREHLVGGDDPTINYFLSRVEPLAVSWESDKQSTTIKLLKDFGADLSSKGSLHSARESLDDLLRLRRNGTVGDVLRHLRDSRLVPLPEELDFRLDGRTRQIPQEDAKEREYEEKDREFFSGFFGLRYPELVAFVGFFNEHTPYSTKHGVKGAEFDTVLVVLDDGGANWNLYSFEKYLSGSDLPKNEQRWKRTRNLFYVCCSRAKKRLAVVDLTERSTEKDRKLATLFGEPAVSYL